MLSIVQMLYLSSKSLFVHKPKHRDEAMVVGGRADRLRGLLLIEIAMGDGHLISKC